MSNLKRIKTVKILMVILLLLIGSLFVVPRNENNVKYYGIATISIVGVFLYNKFKWKKSE